MLQSNQGRRTPDRLSSDSPGGLTLADPCDEDEQRLSIQRFCPLITEPRSMVSDERELVGFIALVA